MQKHTCTRCHKDFQENVTEDHYSPYPRNSKLEGVVVDDVPWLCYNCNVIAKLGEQIVYQK